ENNDPIDEAINGYLRNEVYSSRNLDMHGQEIAFAPSADNTTVETSRITFSAEQVEASSLPPNLRRGPKFFPVIENLEGYVPAIKQIRSSDFPATFKYNDTYINRGFGPENKGKVFMDLVSPISLDFRGESDKAGAFLSPTVNVIALSAITGIVGGRVTGD